MEKEAMLQKMGQEVYETICKMFDDMEYHYERHDEDLVITCKVHGEDIPMDMIFRVRADRQLVQIMSPLPFNIPEEHRMDIAMATTVINNMLVDGSFDFDLSDGSVMFRLTSSYIESILGKELFKYMLMVSATTVDVYNDKFLMIAKGMMSLEQFLEGELKD